MKRLWVIVFIVLTTALACSFPGFGDAPEQNDLPVTETPAQVPSTIPPEATATPLAGETEPAVPAPTQPTQDVSAEDEPGLLNIVYVKDGNLWLWRQSQASQLTSGVSVYKPDLSPDGTMVAFLKQVDDFHTELWAINSDGTNQRRLVGIADLDTIGGGVRDPNAAAINPLRYAWIPGTHTLAFNTYQVFQGPGSSPLDDLHTVDADTATITTLLLSGWGGDFTYSLDGSQIALSKSNQINLVNADGSNWRTVLNYQPVSTYSEYTYYARPVWSPDSAYLRVAIPPADPLAEPRQPTALWFIPLDGSPPRQEGSVLATPFFDTAVAYSPDLASLIYLKETGAPAENRRELMLAKADGSGGWVYQQAALLRSPTWAQDSNTFSFIIGEEQEAWLGRLDAPAAPFTESSQGIRDVRWVTGSLAIFLKDEGGYYSLYLTDLENAPLLIDSASEPPQTFDWAMPAAMP
jgi:hypothetical protein